ncbi:hypothetical protein BKA70DRAFT_1221755 [Coprinopsis sp. MPI-PUGE-AT-0042]|nr:hypothetical protein BKA70DRAFT_1221755 [Coprinopsis sp. MPI-PUGE-AT-0042]
MGSTDSYRGLAYATASLAFEGRSRGEEQWELSETRFNVGSSGGANFRKVHRDTRAKATPGTGVWFLEGKWFRLWLDLNGDMMILWGSGIPGAGKTVLAEAHSCAALFPTVLIKTSRSIVISHLGTWAREANQTICIAYVYIRDSNQAEATIRGILEILIKQTLERHRECQPLVEQLSEGMGDTFYVLDALDEAPVGIRDLIEKLSSLKVHESTSHGSTALLMAAENGQTSVVDVNSMDGDGDSVVKMAAEGGHEATARMLLDFDRAIDLSLVGRLGQTAMSAALANGHTNVARLLRHFAAGRSGVLSGTMDLRLLPIKEFEEDGPGV